MYSVSNAFLNAVSGSHTMVTYAAIMDDDNPLYVLQIVGGDGNANGRDAIRRDATLQLIDPTGDLVINDINDLLIPFGNEMQLWRGVRFSDGTEEMCPWGRYRLDKYQATEDSEGINISIMGYDRAFMVQQPSSKPVVVRAGVTYEDAIVKTIVTRYPGLRYHMQDTGYVTPNLFLKSSLDLWEECRKMATAVGCELYFDAIGDLVLDSASSQIDNTTLLVFSDEDKNITKIDRAISADGLPNGVEVIGENSSLTTGAVRGEAWDDNPRSLTYRYGKYGEVLRSETSEYVITDQQAERAAVGILERELGPYETVTIECVPNPAMDVGDIIYVSKPSIGVEGYYVVTDIAMPWAADEVMSITTRKRVNV